jgi:hypothetical protein
MYRNYSDRVQKINEALRGMLSEQGKYKMYDPKTRTVVDSDAPGAYRVFGEGEKAYIMQGSKKVYLNRPSYNKPLIDAPKTEPTKVLATTVPAEGKLGTIPTGMSAPVVLTQPAMQPEKIQAAQEPKATDSLSSLGGPFKTSPKPPPATKAAPEVPVAGLRGQLMTMPEPAPQERMSRVATSKEDMNKALEAVYKYGSTKETPLASRSELEGYTRDDIEKARRAAVAPKPQPKPMTGGRGKYEMEPMLPESVKNYVNYLDEARGDGFTRKTRRREGAKAARAAKTSPETPALPQQQIAVPLVTSEPAPIQVPAVIIPDKLSAETRTLAARNTGELAARKYLEAHPRKKGLIASILKVMGRGK